MQDREGPNMKIISKTSASPEKIAELWIVREEARKRKDAAYKVAHRLDREFGSADGAWRLAKNGEPKFEEFNIDDA